MCCRKRTLLEGIKILFGGSIDVHDWNYTTLRTQSYSYVIRECKVCKLKQAKQTGIFGISEWQPFDLVANSL